MLRVLLRRVYTTAVTMLLVSIVIFSLVEISPINIARQVLGEFVTPDQEAAFNAQMGFYNPLHLRYISWLAGSDWWARPKVEGLDLTRLPRDDGTLQWWGLREDGTPVRWRFEDGELYRQERGPDGEVTRVLDTEAWSVEPVTGVESFWGVDTEGRVVHWIRGENVSKWAEESGTGWWLTERGGGAEYIPLQMGVLRGDPGVSILTGRPLGPTLVRRFTNSFILAGVAFIAIMPLGLLLGVIAGVNRGRFLDRLISISGLTATASPNYATAMLLVVVFASWLKILPGVTIFDRPDAILADPTMLILPIVTLALIELGYVIRITRASVIEVVDSDYVRTAVLKGLSTTRVIVKHVLRNALMAPITVIMLHVNWLIGGIVVVEMIFGFPGIGRFLYRAALTGDFFALQAGALVTVALAVGTQLVADIIYTLLNPRVRYS